MTPQTCPAPCPAPCPGFRPASRPGLLPLILAVLAVLALPVMAQDARQRVIQVTGEASVGVVPDLVRITVGVTSTERTARAALEATAAAMTALFARLDSEAVPDADRMTSTISLSPVWDHQSSARTPRITGYTAASGVTLTLRDIGRLGALLDALAGDGANRIGGIAFDISDPAAALDAARRAAVADAMARARLYAEAAGVVLGPVLSLTEQGGGMMYSPSMARAEAAMPVAPGEAQVSAMVGMVFALD